MRMRLIMALDLRETSSSSSDWKSEPETSCSTNERRTEMMMPASCRVSKEGVRGQHRRQRERMGTGARLGEGRTIVSRTDRTVGGEAGQIFYQIVGQSRSRGERAGCGRPADSQMMKKMGTEKMS
jgi:hypothetical protein